ncbi:MAG: hypothetical protein CL464_06290 [Acidimicrobiaceae bacterium]|nr:hypothetical protein [Acidimicrobiaceae bacterium]
MTNRPPERASRLFMAEYLEWDELSHRSTRDSWVGAPGRRLGRPAGDRAVMNPFPNSSMVIT